MNSQLTDADRRRRDIARIHIVSKALGLTEDERRDVLFAITAKRSCSDLDFTGLQRVRSHLESRARSRGVKVPAGPPGVRDPMSRKIRALWLSLADVGKVVDRSEKALLAFVKRQTGKDRLEWCTMADKDKVIEALKAWTIR